MSLKREALFPDQIAPFCVAIGVMCVGILLLWTEIALINGFAPLKEPILLAVRWPDVLVGLTIYLKTAVDFALFIGRLMSQYPGWKNRVMIEAGTALGNIVGTLLIVLIWSLFHEVKPLLAAMVIIAGLVLLRLAEDGLSHMHEDGAAYHRFGAFVPWLHRLLLKINLLFSPLLQRIMPSHTVVTTQRLNYWSLLSLGFGVPFILGLDDFAGYVPLFSIINVFGFAIGVFVAHMILSFALFLSPKTTIVLVKHPVVSLLGTLFFIGLAFWGFWEAGHLLLSLSSH